MSIDHGTLVPFLRAAEKEYRCCTPERPPGCFAVLVGHTVNGVSHVSRVEFGKNVRASSPVAVDEFADTIVPCFGAAYANERRGFWCDSRDLLRITRGAEADGLDVLGSVHLHPDWHRIGPPRERALRISQRPTRMDGYLFDNTRWPVNLICYFEGRDDDAIVPTLAAWQPRGDGSEPLPIPLFLRGEGGELVVGDTVRLPPREGLFTRVREGV
ncbi:hypothetical protein AV521_43855 [Streptomyces sp. IMTB 2501]|nr:hypothetical protein AV521_43855 [Streptomyces sp. IMTB 2501]